MQTIYSSCVLEALEHRTPDRGRFLRAGILTLSLFSGSALAVDYSAVADGSWGAASTWEPAGIPGDGDRVTSLGTFDVSVVGDQRIGNGTETVVLEVDDTGALIVEAGASLSVAGHLNHSGWRGEIVVKAGGSLLFDAAAGQQLELQQNNGGQRITFDGAPNNRGLIGLTDQAQGGWHVATIGFRDSRFNGSYGRITDAFNPGTEQGWSMAMANEPGESEFVADHIEFVRCGEISIFGFDAGTLTKVELDALTFRDQAKAGEDYTRPAFWFDGYGDEVVDAGATVATKSLTNIVSDTQINLRYLAGYTLDQFVLGPDGAGNVRDGNNGGNAVSHNNLFLASSTGGSAVSLLANETRNAYVYMTADNPHGFDTSQLRGDAVLSNYWFESDFLGQTDTGDAVVTNGPQYFVTTYGGDVPTLTIENSGTIGDSAGESKHPTLITYNNGDGIKLAVRHSIARIGIDAQAIAIDENGATPVGAGVDFVNSIVYGDSANHGHAIGSPDSDASIESDVFGLVDNNIYFNLKSDGGDGGLGVHEARFSTAPDANSVVGDPLLFDDARNLASWDALLGGPGTASHAISELSKRNDDSGFNPSYNVAALTRYVAEGHSTTRSDVVGSDDLPIGPSLFEVPVVEPPGGGGEPVLVDLSGRGVAAQDRARGEGFIMYSPINLFDRFASRPPYFANFKNFIAVRYGNGRWFYDDNNRYRRFTPIDGDLLVAAVDFSADTATALVGVDTETHGIATGYAEGDLVFTPNQWNYPRFADGEFDIDGTFFTPWDDGEPPPSSDLINGGLEAGVNGGALDFVDELPGWNSTNVVEVWGSGFRGVDSLDGGNFIEIDNAAGGAVDRIWQDVTTEAGKIYVLTFSVRARSNNPRTGDEAVCVEFNGIKTRESCYYATRAGAWSTHEVLVTGTGGADEIAFRESRNTGHSDSTGPFLDNVSFEPVSGELLYRESERADLQGAFRVGLDNSAANRAYGGTADRDRRIVTDLSGSYMEYDYYVATAGDYAIEGGFYVPDSGDNSFWVTVDGNNGQAYLWDGQPNNPVYQPTFVNDRGVTSRVVVSLDVGIHKVRTYLREDGARLDWLRLVSQ